MLAMGYICGVGPVMPAGPSQGSGIGIVPHELHVSVHHLPHQLLQEGERQMRAPVQRETNSMSGMPHSMTRPPGSPHQSKERMGLCWALPTAALVCQCTAEHWGAHRCHSVCFLQSKDPCRGTENGVSQGAQVTPNRGVPLPFPSLQIVFREHEHPAGTKHTRKATHIKRDSRLPVQLLPGFGGVPLQKILWKRRERHCKDCYLPHPDGLPIAPASP